MYMCWPYVESHVVKLHVLIEMSKIVQNRDDVDDDIHFKIS